MQVLYYVGVKRKTWGFVSEWRYTGGNDAVLNAFSMAVKNQMDVLCSKHNKNEAIGCVTDWGYLEVIKQAPLIVVCDYTRRNGKVSVKIFARPIAEGVSVRTSNFRLEFMEHLKTVHKQLRDTAKLQLFNKFKQAEKAYNQIIQNLEIQVQTEGEIYTSGVSKVSSAIKKAADNTIEIIKKNRQKYVAEKEKKEASSQGSVLPAE